MLCLCARGEASRVSHMWESIQPELQPHHPQSETRGRAALPLPPLPLQLPAQSGPAAAPGELLHLRLTSGQKAPKLLLL